METGITVPSLDEVVRQAQAAGYKDLFSVKKVKPGDKLYAVNMGKTVVLFVAGTKPLEDGMKILGAHIDSPRIDIKQIPLYEETEMAFLDSPDPPEPPQAPRK